MIQPTDLPGWATVVLHCIQWTRPAKQEEEEKRMAVSPLLCVLLVGNMCRLVYPGDQYHSAVLASTVLNPGYVLIRLAGGRPVPAGATNALNCILVSIG